MAIAKLGVDMIGLNFVESSPRYLPPKLARKLVEFLPDSCCPVGVFQNHSAPVILAAVKSSGIRMLQFHGDESPDFCTQFGLPFIKVLSMEPQSKHLDNLQPWENAAWLLFDSRVKGQRGGTGVPLDWNLLANITPPCPWMLAGGLGVHNLRLALDTCSPSAVDLNSKVEIAPGIKNLENIALCLQLAGR